MTSRLKLRKKKYHPPLEDSQEQPHIDDDTTKQEQTSHNKTFAEVTRGSNKNQSEDDIFTKAKASAQKHNIKLKAGRKDRGFGNCAFESVINNINDRACFKEILKQTPNWYRRDWMNKMMERIILGICPWNPSYTDEQIKVGFEKLMDSGIYEIDFFGDMMIAGIACGIKKRILIFNISENLQHDPISVVDPNHFDVRIEVDNTTPVVVAYNNYHYESLHPVDDQDKQETIKLAQSYIQNRYHQEYGFTKKDIKYLISPAMIIDKSKTSQQEFKQSSIKESFKAKGRKVGKVEPPQAIRSKQTNAALRKREEPNITENAAQQIEIIQEESIQPLTEVQNKQKQTAKKVNLELKAKKKDSEIELITQTLDPDKFLFVKGKLRFEEIPNGKIKCGGCKDEYTRILGHLNRNNSCSKHIDINEFKAYWIKFSGRKRVKKCYQKKKENDKDQFLKVQASRKRKCDQVKKKNNPDQFLKDQAERKRKSNQCKKKENPDQFLQDQAYIKRKCDQVEKIENPPQFLKE